MRETVSHTRAQDAHRAEIDKLARELHLPASQVEIVYLEQLRRIEREARIKTFIPVLAVGSARTQLQRGRKN